MKKLIHAMIRQMVYGIPLPEVIDNTGPYVIAGSDVIKLMKAIDYTPKRCKGRGKRRRK